MQDPSQLRRRLLALAVAGLIAGVAFAQKAPSEKPAAGGQASGTFTVSGKTVQLTHAAAFVDQKDKRKPVVLILSDQELPAASWTSDFDLVRYRMDHKSFGGVAFWFDAKREVFRTDYYEKDDFPTSATGVFELKLDDAKGKVLSGSARSTKAGESLSNPVKLDVRFSVTLK